MKFTGEAALVQLKRRYGGFQTMVRPRRVAEGLDDLKNVNVVLDCMQERRRGTDGGA
jgi:hypothetical protein